MVLSWQLCINNIRDLWGLHYLDKKLHISVLLDSIVLQTPVFLFRSTYKDKQSSLPNCDTTNIDWIILSNGTSSIRFIFVMSYKEDLTTRKTVDWSEEMITLSIWLATQLELILEFVMGMPKNIYNLVL